MERSENSLVNKIVELFLRGNLSILVIGLSIVAGIVALVVTPREEEPQIIVPMADVFIEAPGLSVDEVERLVATRLERLLFQIDGVEHVYSMSSPGSAIVTVRFLVGENREDSLLKVYNKVHSNLDRIPEVVTRWVVKPVEIDDVPVLNVALWSQEPTAHDDHALRRIAEELELRLQAVPDTNKTFVIGGRPRVVVVELDPPALAARQTSALEVMDALRLSNVEVDTSGFDRDDTRFLVEAGGLFRSADELAGAVVNVVDGASVFLRDVASVRDGPSEADGFSWLVFTAASPEVARGVAVAGMAYPAVHVAVAKKKGVNAVRIAEEWERRLAVIAPKLLPEGVSYVITRNYGETADDKVDELLEGLAIAIVVVIGLIALVLGWREAWIVAVAVPITFSLTLLINYLLGYSINRVTLFALTLALGLVVDDPIVDVENIYRHLKMRREPPLRAVLSAVREVRPPIILATLAVIVSFLPLFFITGMMGPYMQPMAVNVPLAMLMSLVVAFTVTPWMAYRAMRGEATGEPGEGGGVEAAIDRVYRAILEPLLAERWRGWALLAIMALLLVGAFALAGARAVPLKMLPFDNKNEFQIVIDLPEGTTLERTDAMARAVADAVQALPEVTRVQVYSGTPSAMDFNGMVRHYYLRRQPHAAEVRVDLLDKDERVAQSHAIALRLRPLLDEIAARYGARLAIVEMPPGPPVLSTITAEVYGDDEVPYSRLRAAAERVADRLRREPLVVDVDTSNAERQERWSFRVDREKAALSGIATADVAALLQLALDGTDATQLHAAHELHPLSVKLRVARSERSSVDDLASLYVKGRPGYVQERASSGVRDAPVAMVQLGELGRFAATTGEAAIYHKDLRRVAYVFAETAGRPPGEAILDVITDRRDETPSASSGAPRPLAARSYFDNGGGDLWSLPTGTRAAWAGEGEWQVTLDVFRDLGIAFGVAVFGIYVLLVYQTGSYSMPLILMISIPLTMIGILPGFWLLNAIGAGEVGSLPDPIFVTATAMIGMIALAGIAVRNAILLIEFVHERLREGAPLQDALLASGAVRFRPIFLTAGTAMLAAWPITLDPIFSGLAWALIFGLFVSTAFTLVVIPVTYDLVYRRRPGHGLVLENDDE